MSLNYNITKCKSLTDEEKKDFLFPICSVCMVVGIDKLNKETLPEFLHRLKLWEAVGGLYLSHQVNGHSVSAFTEELVSKFEGLETNVRNESFAKFSKRVLTRES